MSFKLFTLQFLGKIKPVEKVESQRKSLLIDYNEFMQVDKSEELVQFLKLEKQLNSEDFKKRKAELQALQFKNSKEYNLLQEYETLKKKKSIKKYFEAANSNDLKQFEAIKNSEKLKEYETLSEYVKEGEFQKQKREIEIQKYKGSVEEQHLIDLHKLEKSDGIKAYLMLHNSQQIERHRKTGDSDKIKKYLDLKNTPDKDKQQQKEFNALRKDSEIKHYFKFEQSNRLKLYRETVDSHELKKYEDLKAFVSDAAFKKRVEYLKDKKKFEKSEAHKKLRRYKEISGDTDIKFFLKYEKSAIHKNYLDVKDSFDLKRYLELEEIVSSKEFKERKAYLEDKNKWEKTEEYANEKKYLELKNKPHLVKYFKYKGSNAFSFFNEWEVTFTEDFTSARLDTERWALMPLWAEKMLGRNYALPGDMHVYTLGQNIKTGGKLSIETRKEKAEGLVWKMPAGFIPQSFEYTSGLISTAKSFWQNDGIFEAKIKFNPVKEVVSSCVLQGENNAERVYLLEMGAKNRLGVARTGKDGKQELEGIDVSNLNKNKWYIFTLEKSHGNFTWKINETEVHKMEHNGINFPLHINLMTLVLDPISSSKLPVEFQTEWVRCYKRKG
jgi:hypothetical protein